MAISPGTEIGGYVVQAVAGRGGHAVVYRARSSTSGMPVALKALGDELEPDGGWMTITRQVSGGAPAALVIDHPDVVATLAGFEHDGTMFVVQEWADGGTLEDELDQREQPTGAKPDAERAARVGIALARALVAVHERGQVHRDVKPSNVLIVNGRYKLGDFGVAGLVQPRSGLTAAGVIAGTPRYMAPEQFTGFGVGPAADVFALGLVLLEVLHGHLSGEGAANFSQLAYQRTAQDVDVPDSPLAALVRRCVERDPARRPSAAEVQRSLEAWLADSTFPGLGGPQLPGAVGTAPPAAIIAPPPATGGAPGADGWSAGPVSSGATFPGIALVTAAAGAIAGVALVTAVGAPTAVRVLLAAALVGGGIGAGSWIRRRLARQEPEIGRRAADVVFGADERDDLSRSLMVEVEDVIRSLERVDDRVLGLTLVGMVAEYRDATESSERQAALVNVVTIMEKVQTRLSPWPVRHRDAVAVAVTVVGCATGVATLLTGWLA